MLLYKLKDFTSKDTYSKIKRMQFYLKGMVRNGIRQEAGQDQLRVLRQLCI
ncbi:hypothetical protein CBFG_05361 [Clostridiales bacterium 1_7_47FAA]|nr:hypothetical protein CBFG_05361 [Clostridiales bacterium 1_7_47FAA]